MRDKAITENLTDSHEVEEEEEKEERTYTLSPRPSLLSPELRAMLRIRNKYQALKKRNIDPITRHSSLAWPSRENCQPTGPTVFTMDGKEPPNRKKRRRCPRVLFPSDNRKVLPVNVDKSRAKPFLILFSIIVFLQVYNAIENLDDHVAPYDLEGLEKTLSREMYGQQGAIEELIEHLQGYLTTYTHTQPLALALHGPSGVGKSHLGRLLVRHFRSILGEELVVHYITLHHCPLLEDAGHCARKLSLQVEEVVGRAEVEEKIPVFVLDEVEAMQMPLLDMLHGLLHPKKANEHLNAIYVLLSNLGQEEITRHILQNTSGTAQTVGPQLRQTLAQHHPLWAGDAVEVVPLGLLEKSHVMDCLLEEMTQEGFYPDHAHIERLAEELTYHNTEGHQYSRFGCKQVVTKVNLL